ncbi:MAG: GNAT family N-acetyltransferase [Fusobacteriota bacterium]
MDLTIIYNYKDNDKLRKSFNKLCEDTFGISFEKWYQKGLWKGDYICYSYYNGEKIISNVSVTKMRLRENGKIRKVLQIGTVMTDKDYRNQGLARKLMEFVEKKYRNEFETFLLFANNSVRDFYPKFGYKIISRDRIFVDEKIKRSHEMEFRKLNINNKEDIKILRRIGRDRIPTSNRFFIENNEEILFWYCVTIFTDNIYYNKENDTIAIYSLENKKLNIYDIVSTKKVDYKKVIQSITSDEVEEIELHMNIDDKNIKFETKKFDDIAEDDPLFVKGDLDMKGITYPMMSHT